MKKLLALTVNIALVFVLYGQNTESSLEISGYADAYWKFDFAQQENITTYFANDHNSISLGMIALGLKKSAGKALFVGELGFGPRGQYLSIPNGDGAETNDKNSFHIQNLYMSYNFTKSFSLTAGFMGTFVGYEVISPVSNFHYSTSYLFGAGPFQNAGIKANYNFSDKISLMLGLFNDWNVYRDFNGVSHVGGQLMIEPIDGLTTYLNFLTGTSDGGDDNYSSGTLYDLVTTYDFSDKVSLALNAADYTFNSKGGYSGVALYPQYNFNEHIGIGLRGEYFKIKDVEDQKNPEFTSFTLTAKLQHKGLALIPEIRLDNDNQAGFFKKDGITSSKQASQASLAVVYSF